MTRFCISLLFASFCCFLLAQPKYSISDTDNVLTQKEKVSLEKAIDFQTTFYNLVFPEDTVKLSDVRLNIYNDYAAYLLYQKEQTRTTLHNSMGFYSRKNKEAVVCKAKNEKRFLLTSYYELSHYFINTHIERPPVWINEGLAEYFTHLNYNGKIVKPNVYDYAVNRVKTMIQTRDINLVDFLTWDANKFYKMSFTHDNYGYSLGYCIILFLMQKDQNVAIEFIRQIKSEKSGVEAFNSCYEGGFADFEKEFLAQYSK